MALTDQLGYADDKVQLLLNRADSGYGIRQQDVESSIGRKISHSIVSDGRTVVYALNRGVPFVVSARQARVSEDVVRLARNVLANEENVPADIAMRAAARKGLFQWRAH